MTSKNINSKKRLFLIFGIIYFIVLGSIFFNFASKSLKINTLSMEIKTSAINNYVLDLDITWGFDDEERGDGITVDGSGNIYIAGYTDSFSPSKDDAYIAKFDSYGHLEWNIIKNRTGSNTQEKAKGIAIDALGRVFITGYNYFPEYDVFLTKYDTNGNMLKNVTWDKSNVDQSWGIDIDNLGNVYITGRTNISGVSEDIFIAKYDNECNSLKNITWDWNGNDDVGFDIALDSSGNIYITGTTKDSMGHQDVFITKCDTNGNFVKNITWDKGDFDDGNGIALDESGNIYITGRTDSAGNNDVILLKYDSAGDSIFNITWGGDGSDVGRDIALDESGNIYITGWTETTGGNYDAFIIKYDQNGNLLFYETWGGDDYDSGNCIVLDASGDIYIAGDTNSYGMGDVDTFFLKYSLSTDQGNLPFGLLDIFTSPIGLITVFSFLGAGLLAGLLIGRKKWGNDTAITPNNNKEKLEKKKEKSIKN